MKKILFVVSFLLALLTTGAQTLIVFDGNSLTDGAGSSTTRSSSTDMDGMDYPAQCSRMFSGGSYTFYNFAVSGQTTTQMAGDAASQIDPLYNASNTHNIIVVWEITNALSSNGGVPPSQAHTDFKNYCLARKAVGWEVVVVNVISRPALNPQFEPLKDEVNGYIESQYPGYADALADVAGLSLTYVDGVHVNDASYTSIANTVYSAIQSVINGDDPPPTPTPQPAIIIRGRKGQVVHLNNNRFATTRIKAA